MSLEQTSLLFYYFKVNTKIRCKIMYIHTITNQNKKCFTPLLNNSHIMKYATFNYISFANPFYVRLWISIWWQCPSLKFRLKKSLNSVQCDLINRSFLMFQADTRCKGQRHSKRTISIYGQICEQSRDRAWPTSAPDRDTPIRLPVDQRSCRPQSHIQVCEQRQFNFYFRLFYFNCMVTTKYSLIYVPFISFV